VMPTFAGLKKLKVRNGEVCFLTSLQKSDCWASKVPKTTNRKAGVDSKGAENSDDASNGPLRPKKRELSKRRFCRSRKISSGYGIAPPASDYLFSLTISEVSSSRAQSRDLFFAESNLLFLFPREKQIKAWRREKKVALIEAANPIWEDLAAEWDARGTNG